MPEDSFEIRCRRCLPMLPPGNSFKSSERIKPYDFMDIIPCWFCGGRLIRDEQAPQRAGTVFEDYFYLCIGCGRSWLIQAGGNPDWIVLRVSIPKPETGKHWASLPKNEIDAAWLKYVESMDRLGADAVERTEWEKRRT